MAKEVTPKIETCARIKVLGVGGAGSAAVDRMIETAAKNKKEKANRDLEFIAVNTDAQALSSSKALIKINIGSETTRGLGAGSDPMVGEKAAEESIDEIKEIIKDTDMLFIALGAGGGTGSGAAHVIAKVAREMGILTVAFATRPFSFEGECRERNANYAISKLEEAVDTLVLIPNDRILETVDNSTSLPEAFKIADDVLRQGVQGISDLITVPGTINLDFADVKAIMRESGQALMGIGRASGENRAQVAARQAVESPLLDISIDGARGVLFNVIGGEDMTMHEIDAAASVITEVADQNANVIFGANINPELDGEIIVTVVATGFGVDYLRTRDQGSSDQGMVSDYHDDDDFDDDFDDDDDILPPPSVKRPSAPRGRRGHFQRKPSSARDSEDELGDDVDSIVRNVDKTMKSKEKSSVIDSLDDEVTGGIWDTPDEEDIDRPTFLRRRQRRKNKAARKQARAEAKRRKRK